MKQVKGLGIILFVMLIQACATSNAQKVRENRSVTATIFTAPGAIYRPNGHVGIGAVYQSYKRKNDKILHSPENAKVFGSDEFTTNETRSRGVDTFVHYYPWSTSAFFFGLGLKSTASEYSLAVNNEGTTLNESDTNFKYSSKTTKVKVPVGWSWIYENGFSLLLDMGLKVATNEVSSTNVKGEAIDTERQKLLTEDLSSDSKGTIFEPIFTLGYSF
jgi:hypothetical protein